MATLQAIKYSPGKLEVLDQLRLPHVFRYDDVKTCEEAFDCIRSMRVRGAPAIAIVAVLGLAVELQTTQLQASTVEDTIAHIDQRLDYLKESRPTAVDLANSITLLKGLVRAHAQKSSDAEPRDIVAAYVAGAEEYMNRDLQTNLAIGDNGAAWLRDVAGASADKPISVLTHCNTGSLATSGHGTALGIIRSLQSSGVLRHAFCTETRPYNQGSRLTAFELVHEGIPATLVTDSMAAALFATRGKEENIAAVIVGADRVVANGDTANKIGTYALAVLAKYHGIKFVVAAPRTSIDLLTAEGKDITIEQRKGEEVTQVTGPVVGSDGKVDERIVARVATADQRIGVWNPAFDVTPHELIDAIVTEAGVVVKDGEGRFDLSKVKSA
ncbi:probable cig2 protein (putative GDP-GTP exchange factor) [Cephalotrichum gorgonifer]|uniref:Methylthioribose-1-phosphate isomerase n=1 Tax=Cephalotrichum gorgonifer TaxID=2041049 RepID=A0AAE8SQV6_9PEZI|nr:probable cig2 protein (putative GDP-GTP exchange factor) [Cephalotrichum gorgonifer]